MTTTPAIRFVEATPTEATPAPSRELPVFRTCPICKEVKPEAQVKMKVELDGEVVEVCSRCYQGTGAYLFG